MNRCRHIPCMLFQKSTSSSAVCRELCLIDTAFKRSLSSVTGRQQSVSVFDSSLMHLYTIKTTKNNNT